MSVNRVCLTGNLTKDPNTRRTASGTAIVNFSIAVNERRKNPQTGDYEDYANFIDCVMFGTRGEAVANYLSKGSKVALEGKLHYSTWDKGGQKRSKLEVLVDEIEFMSKAEKEPQQAPQQQTPQQAPQQTSAVYDDDIPF